MINIVNELPVPYHIEDEFEIPDEPRNGISRQPQQNIPRDTQEENQVDDVSRHTNYDDQNKNIPITERSIQYFAN